MEKIKSIITKVEEKYVFNVSRSVFAIIVAVSSILFTIAVFVLLYSWIPPSKDEVYKSAYPEEQKISTDEIVLNFQPTKNEIKTEAESPKDVSGEKPPPSEEYKETVDSLQIRLNLAMDSLRALVGNGWYGGYEQYVAYYDYFNRPVYSGRYTSGLYDKFYDHLDKYTGSKTERIEVIDFLIKTLNRIDAKNRLNAVKYYMKLKRNRASDRQQQIDAIENEYYNKISMAEAKYEEESSKKSELNAKAQLGIVGGIGIIAIVGLILCLLAIERNTRAVRELLLSKKKENNGE